MTNEELITKFKAEIERRIEESRTRQKNLEDIGQENANIVEEHIRASLKVLLSFLSTLESETKEEKKVPTRIYLGSKYEFIRKDVLLNEIERLKKNNEVSDDKEYASYELDVACGYDMACDDIFSFLKPFVEVDKHSKNIIAPSKECEPGLREPLESEKLMNPDGLEEEIIKCWQEWVSPSNKQSVDGVFPLSEFAFYARHFAKWGAEHAKIDVTDFCKPIDPGIAQCIADHSWEMLGEDEKPIPKDLEEAVNNHIRKVVDAAGHPGWDWTTDDIRNAYIAGYKLHEANTPLPEDTVLFNKGVEEGKRLMMEEAVDAKFISMDEGIIKYSPLFTRKLKQTFRPGDKVRIIILPKED